MANITWNPGTSNDGLLTSVITLMTTELQSLANASGAISSVNGTSGKFTNANTSQALYASLFFSVGNPAPANPSAGANLAGWFIESPDSGTTYEKTSVVPVRAPDFIIPVLNGTLAAGDVFKTTGPILLPTLQFRVYVQNNTGVTLGSGATTAPYLRAAPYTLSY